MVERPSRRSGSGWEALPEVREWSGVPPGGPGVVGRPSCRSGWPIRTSGNGCEALPEVREWSVSPPEGPEDPGVVGSPSRWSMIGRETLP